MTVKFEGCRGCGACVPPEMWGPKCSHWKWQWNLKMKGPKHKEPNRCWYPAGTLHVISERVLR